MDTLNYTAHTCRHFNSFPLWCTFILTQLDYADLHSEKKLMNDHHMLYLNFNLCVTDHVTTVHSPDWPEQQQPAFV